MFSHFHGRRPPCGSAPRRQGAESASPERTTPILTLTLPRATPFACPPPARPHLTLLPPPPLWPHRCWFGPTPSPFSIATAGLPFRSSSAYIASCPSPPSVSVCCGFAYSCADFECPRPADFECYCSVDFACPADFEPSADLECPVYLCSAHEPSSTTAGQPASCHSSARHPRQNASAGPPLLPGHHPFCRPTHLLYRGRWGGLQGAGGLRG